MARRRERKGLADDLLAIAAKLPWWVSLGLAAVSYLALHAIASQDVGTVTSTQQLGTFAARNLYRALARFGQFILPLIFLAGALVGVLGQRKR